MTDLEVAGAFSSNARLPWVARSLGFAGLLPQVVVVLMLSLGSPWWHFRALALGYIYAALILSFLGGMWWGLAAGQPDRAPAWVWSAAILPSLIALVTAVPWVMGWPWPGPSLLILGVALLASLLVDQRLVAMGVAPGWWMALRTPLSIGLGGLTLVTAALA